MPTISTKILYCRNLSIELNKKGIRNKNWKEQGKTITLCISRSQTNWFKIIINNERIQ